jgi:hypothetical protein
MPITGTFLVPLFRENRFEMFTLANILQHTSTAVLGEPITAHSQFLPSGYRKFLSRVQVGWDVKLAIP